MSVFSFDESRRIERIPEHRLHATFAKVGHRLESRHPEALTALAAWVLKEMAGFSYAMTAAALRPQLDGATDPQALSRWVQRLVKGEGSRPGVLQMLREEFGGDEYAAMGLRTDGPLSEAEVREWSAAMASGLPSVGEDDDDAASQWLAKAGASAAAE